MINATNAASTGAQPASSSASQAAALTSDFETFLLMLTAQARNQDPLEPMDSSEYASQLAQFSMVEQQVQTNDLLSSLATVMGGQRLEELSSWVGTEILSSAPFSFTGKPIDLFAQAEATADSAKMIIRDETGTVIDRIPVDPNDTEFVWAGTDGSGAPLPAGTYSAALESYKNGEVLSQSLAATYSHVLEAQIVGGLVQLRVESGAVVDSNNVSAIRTGA